MHACTSSVRHASFLVLAEGPRYQEGDLSVDVINDRRPAQVQFRDFCDILTSLRRLHYTLTPENALLDTLTRSIRMERQSRSERRV